MLKFVAGILALFPFSNRSRRKRRMDVISFWHGLSVRRRAKRVGTGLRCHAPVKVSRKTVIGEHVHFNGAHVFGTGNVTFGKWVHSGEGLRIFTRNHNYDKGAAIPYDDTFIEKDVAIGDFAWIGAYVILLPGTTIGEGAVIQAGSVVHGEIPPMAIAGGNPAKVFAWRDREHFARLKAEGRFH